MYERVRVDMITNQADKQKIWEVMKPCITFFILAACYHQITELFDTFSFG